MKIRFADDVTRRECLKILAGGATTLGSSSALPLTAAQPDTEHQAIVDAFSEVTVAQKAIYDDQGHVVKLALSNHTGTGFWEAGNKQPPPGVDDALFQRVLELPTLQAIALEMQPLSNQGYSLLGQLKRLTDVRLHYIGKYGPASNPPDKDAPLFINQLPRPLEVLEIKHCFSIRGGCMEKLKAQPALRKLEIDTGYAGSTAVGFIGHSPRLENLQIHRTTMSDSDLQTIFASLPDLEVLLIRPHRQKRIAERITWRSLRGLARCPKLRLLVLGLEWGDWSDETALDVLAELPKLERLDVKPSDIEGLSLDHPSMRRLHEARPDIEIRHGRETIGGAEGRITEQEDADWKWDGGVTTHG